MPPAALWALFARAEAAGSTALTWYATRPARAPSTTIAWRSTEKRPRALAGLARRCVFSQKYEDVMGAEPSHLCGTSFASSSAA